MLSPSFKRAAVVHAQVVLSLRLLLSALGVALDKTVSRSSMHAATGPVNAAVNTQSRPQSVGDVWDAT